MRPKERRDCGQKDLFCARLDQMARFFLIRIRCGLGGCNPSCFRLAGRPPV